MSHRWADDDELAPRLDLRLAVPAVAVWVGCIVALRWPAAVWWWVLAVVAVVLAAVAAVRHAAHGAWRPSRARMRAILVGLVGSGVCAALAMLTAAATVVAAERDPLQVAAAQGDWVVADVALGADPIPVMGGFGADDDARPAGESSADAFSRWRLVGRARAVHHAGVTSTSTATVTLLASGASWADLRAHETVRVRGAAAVDPFSVVPGTTIRARGDPELRRAAPWWFAWANVARSSLTRVAATLEPEQGGLLRGLVVGDTAGIGPDLDADAKATGLTHLLAVSGSHLAIIAGIVVLLLRRFGPWASSAGVIATFALLVMLVGPSPSVVRSVAMGLIGVVATVVGRASTGVAALAGSVFLLLLADPSLALSAGFSLSVLATAGLLLLAPSLVRAIRRRGVPVGWAMLVALPIAAHLTTVPVIAAMGGNVSLAAVPANIAVTPVVTPALLLGLGCLVTGPWWPSGAEFLAGLDAPLLGWVIAVAHRLARWPWAVIPWSPSAGGIAALVATLLVTVLLFRFRRSRLALLSAIAGVVVVLIVSRVASVGWPGDGWLVTMCDVGQGDGVVLSTDAPGVAVVVDTGPAGADMAGCLDRLGVREVALLVLTHLHADHTGGLLDVTADRVVRGIAVGPDQSDSDTMATVARLAGQRGLPVEVVAPGARWTTAGLSLTVLGPTRRFHGTESDPNNDSVVLMAERRGVRMLLCGDIEQPAQQALLRSGADLRADVFKQPHHGSSKLLPDFVAAVSPQIALIGVGADNDYGHPSATALRIDVAAGVRAIARTDTGGDVQVLLTDDGLATIARGPASTAAG